MKNQHPALPPITLLAAALAAGFAAGVQALPSTPTVTNGSASFQQSGSALNVTNSNGAIIQWNSFSIGAGESTRFIQPSVSSSVLNRVLGNNPSQIYGSLSSNGRIYLVNPGGIFVGPSGRVDAAAFVASTLALTDQDFLAGRLAFARVGTAGAVENQGVISTPEGGSVYLLGAQVTNHGSIAAPNGEVVLAAGQAVQLVNTGTPGVTVEFSASDENVQNFGAIATSGGQIGLAAALVKNSGSLNASSVSREGGRIFLRASKKVEVDAAGRILANGTQGGTVQLRSDDLTLLAGGIEAKGATAAGGRIEVLGDKVGVFDGASVDASGSNGGGTVLVGGDFQGKNAEVKNAFVSWLGKDARLTADAVERGDGGKIIVWADDTTRSSGQISARGGKLGGDGGLVEVSGKRYLDFHSPVDVGAPAGNGGTLLLDPMDVTIVFGTIVNPFAFYGDGIWNEPADANAATTLSWTSYLGADGIQDLLNASTNVVITTAGAYAGPVNGGSITLAYGGSPFSWTTNATLKLLAHQDITIGESVVAPSGTLEMVAAWNGDLGTPNVVPAAAGTITEGTDGFLMVNTVKASAGGAVNLNHVNNQVANLKAFSDSGSITYNGGASAGANDIYLMDLRAPSGSITVNTNNAFGGNITLGDLRADTGAGSVNITARKAILEDDVGTADILAANANLTSQTGATGSATLAISADTNVGNSLNAFVSGGTYGGIRINEVGSGHDHSFSLSDSNVSFYGGQQTIYKTASSITKDFAINSNQPVVLESMQTIDFASAWSFCDCSELIKTNTAATNAITVVSHGAFTGNDSGANPNTSFVNNAGTRWLVYAPSPTPDHRGTLEPDFKQYNAPPGTTPLGTGNGFLYSIAPLLSVTASGNVSKVYNGSSNAPIKSITLTVSGEIDSDVLGSATASSATFSSKNVGTNKTVTVGGLSAPSATFLWASDNSSHPVYGYQYLSSSPTLQGNITPATLTVSGGTSLTRVYDGTAKATFPNIELTGVIQGDVVTAVGTGSFADKNVGVDKVATASVVLSGSGAGNYTVAPPGTFIGTITPAPLSLNGVTSISKVYDGNVNANFSNIPLSGVIQGDIVTATGTGKFADKNVGIDKVVTASVLVSGLDSGNYTLPPPAAGTFLGTITPALLSFSTMAANDKVYDGKTMAPLSIGALNGLIAGDQVSLTGGGVFASKNVGLNLPVTTNLVLTGVDAQNYLLAQPSGLAANISRLAAVAWTGTGGDNRWSNPANWVGEAIPDLANVGRVTIPGGAAVQYDLTTATSLDSLSSAGNLSFSGSGAIDISGALNTVGLEMNGGKVSVASLAVSDSFKSGSGTLVVADAATIHQTSGDLVFNINAGSANLSAEKNISGVFNQSSPRRLNLQSAVSTAGNIDLTAFGGLNTTGTVAAPLGSVRLTAMSPMVIGSSGVQAQGDIVLTAAGTSPDDTLTLNGPLASASGDVTLSAYSVTQNAPITTGGGNVAVDANSDLSLNAIEAGTGDVALSSGGSISSNITGVNIVADQLTVQAAKDVTLTTEVRSATFDVGGSVNITDLNAGTSLTTETVNNVIVKIEDSTVQTVVEGSGDSTGNLGTFGGSTDLGLTKEGSDGSFYSIGGGSGEFGSTEEEKDVARKTERFGEKNADDQQGEKNGTQKNLRPGRCMA